MAQTKVKLISDGVIVQSNLHASHGITTAHIGEGSNLYYTDARSRAAISVSGNALSYNSSTGVITSNFEESPTFTGAVVGSSFSATGGFLNGSNGGIRIHTSGTKFFNITAANAARDNIMDIGASDARFKDLYLGGSVTAASATFTGDVQLADTKNLQFVGSSGDHARIVYTQGNGTTGDNWGLTFYQNSGSAAGIDFFASSEAAGDGNIRLATGGSERMRITSGGNVGIGITSPSRKLEVNGTSTFYDNMYISSSKQLQWEGGNYWTWRVSGTQFQIYRGDTTDVPFLVDTSGNVGIGVSSLQSWARLQVAGTAGAQTGANQALYVTSPSTTAGEGVGIRLSAASGSNEAVGIIGMVNNASGNAGSMTFHTYNLGADIPERMRITSGGNVGIGTTDPDLGGVAGTRVLTIASPTAERWGILELAGNRTWGGNQVGEIKFISTDSTNNGVLVSLTAINDPTSTGTGGSLIFKTRPNGGSLTERMRIDSSGNVGIGTTNPTYKLHVSGGDVFTSADKGYIASYNNTTSYHGALRWAALQLGNNGGNRIIAGRTATGGVLDFYTNNTNDASTYSVTPDGNHVMRMAANGDVGIGTTSPGAKLDIVGTSSGSITNLMRIQNPVNSAGTGHGSSLILHSTPDSNRGVAIASSSATNYATNNNMLFYTSSSSTLYERMRIDSNGQVGIGTTLPSAQLHLYNTSAGATPMLQVMSHATAAGSFTGNYMVEFCHAFSTVNHGMLIKNNEAAAGRNTLDVADANGVFATFVNGQVGIGETGPAAKLHITKNAGASTTAEILRLDCGETNHQSGKGGKIVFRDINVYSDTATIEAVRVGSSSASELKLTTRGTTRSVISRDGHTKMSNTGTFYSISGPYHEMNQTTSANWTTIIHNDTSSPFGLFIKYSNAAPNGASNEFLYCQDSGTTRMYILSNGAIYNNGTYGTLSDQKLKENIVDATPKLDDINKLKVRNFNFKDKPEEKHIGFIAQEFEEVFPSMIETTQDKDDDNNPIEDSYTKTIKSSVLIPMLVKSIQELKAEIENLKTQINN